MLTDAQAALTQISERLVAPRIGTSYMREMDKDILALRAAAEMITALTEAVQPWEYVAHITGWADTTITSDTPMPEMQATHRRRKAGPWEPVTEPHLADGTLHGSLS